MNGKPRCLVSRTSAISCLPASASPGHSVAIHRTHSDLVKFASHDSEYVKVAYVLGLIQQTSANRGTRDKEPRSLQNRVQSQGEGAAAIPATRLIDEPHFTKSAKRSADDTVRVMPPKRPRTGSRSTLIVDKPLQAGNVDTYGPPSQDDMEHIRNSLVEQLYFSKIDERLTHLTSAQGTTCRWFLTNP